MGLPAERGILGTQRTGLAGVEPLAPNTDDKKLQFAYDHMGRRVLKRVWTYTAGSWGNPTAETKYVYDGWRVIMELDGLNSDAVTRKFTWGLDLSGSVEGAGGIVSRAMAAAVSGIVSVAMIRPLLGQRYSCWEKPNETR